MSEMLESKQKEAAEEEGEYNEGKMEEKMPVFGWMPENYIPLADGEV